MIKTMKDYDDEVIKSIRRNITKELEDRNKELSRLDRIREDILHILEGSEKLNAAELCMIAIALRKVLRTRRVIKKRKIVLDTMLEALKKGSNPNEIRKLGYKTQDEMKGNILKYYNLRFLKCKDSKVNPILAQVNDALSRFELNEYENDYDRI